MRIADINPHLRCAECFLHQAEERAFYVKDCRLLYLAEGKGEIEICQEKIPLKRDFLFYCPGDTVYTLRAEAPLSLIALNFDLSQRASRYTLPLAREAADVSKNKFPVDKQHIEDSAFLNGFMLWENAAAFKGELLAIVKEYGTKRPLFREVAGTMLKALLLELHREGDTKAMTAEDAVAEVLNFIASHYATPIKNSDLAELTGYHEYYLNRLFLRHTGMSIHQYILAQRMDEARKLLCDTAFPLSHVAAAVGFGSPAHFASHFKKEMGISPSLYRRKYRGSRGDA